jgi:putative ABC transport system permease protein
MRWIILKKSFRLRRGKVLIAIGAIIISISLTTALIELYIDMGEKLGKELRAYGANILITPLSMEVGSGNLIFGHINEKNYFSEDKIRTILSKAKEIIDSYNFSLYGKAFMDGQEVNIIGVDNIKKTSDRWRIKGRKPYYLNEALMGINITKNRNNIILSSGNRKFKLKIVGRVETGGEEDKSIIVDIKIAQSLLNLPGKISNIMINGKSYRYPISSITKKLKEFIPYGDVKTIYQIAYAEGIILKKANWLVILVSIATFITSFITLVSIINAMVLEREEEIGLLKALGGSKKFIISMFLLEAFIIGLIGGLSGYFIGIIMAQLISKSIFDSFFSISLYIVLFSVGIGIVINLLATISPIRTALKVESIAKLKLE